MFKVENDILTKAVSFVSTIVAKTQVISPVLQNIKLTFDDKDGLKFETTNTDISCFYTIERSLVETKTKGFVTTVPALKLNDILKKIGSEKLSCKFIKTNEKEVFVIKTAKSKFLLDCLPSATYPSQRVLDYANNFTIKASDLLNAINRVKFSVCTDEARFYINGILLDTNGKDTEGNSSLNIVSTDSHRLSVQSIPMSLNIEASQVIIPKRSIQKVIDILSIAKDNDVLIEINKTKLKITFNGCSVSSNLIEGEFPQYQRVIPQNCNLKTKILKSELQKAINNVSAIFSGSAYNVVKLNFSSKNILEVEASRSTKNLGSDIGIAKYKMECECSFDNEFSVSYNYSYITDCLNAIDSKKCEFSFSESSKPCLVKPVSDNSEETKESSSKEQSVDYKFVIMPIRV